MDKAVFFVQKLHYFLHINPFYFDLLFFIWKLKICILYGFVTAFDFLFPFPLLQSNFAAFKHHLHRKTNVLDEKNVSVWVFFGFGFLTNLACK